LTLVDQVTALIDRIGGTVTFDELLYQVEKKNLNLTGSELLDVLRTLERDGRVVCDLRVRLV